MHTPCMLLLLFFLLLHVTVHCLPVWMYLAKQNRMSLNPSSNIFSWRKLGSGRLRNIRT